MSVNKIESWDECLPVQEAAKLARLTPVYLYELARKKKVPHVKRGRFLRFPPRAFRAWNEERTRVEVIGVGSAGA